MAPDAKAGAAVQPVKLDDKFAQLRDHWSPRIVAQLNDLHVKVVKVQGEFVWHAHAETDELFWVRRGRLTLRLRDRDVVLEPGSLFVVPRGVEHCPVADDECEVVLIEPAGTVNTGDAGGPRTASADAWI